MVKNKKPFLKGFRFPIYPTEEQQKIFQQFFGCTRKIYNLVLDQKNKEHEEYRLLIRNNKLAVKPDVGSIGLGYLVKVYREMPEFSYLEGVPYDILKNSLRNLGAAYEGYNKHGRRHPKFKKKDDSYQSFNVSGDKFKFDKNKNIIIQKCQDPIKIVYTREMKAIPNNCTIIKESTGKYFISFTVQHNPEKTSGTGIIGVDLGLSTLATLSSGEKLGNPRHYKSVEQKLKRAKRSLARKKKGSANYAKARLKVAKIYARSANSRKDHLHKLSRRLVNENQVIGIEHLRVKNMVKNPRLSKHITDAGWCSFFSMLSYKCRDSQHCTLVRIGTFYASSHICHNTGFKLDRKLSLREREWLCPYCGEVHDRDITAAINIRNEALRIYSSFEGKDISGATLLGDALKAVKPL